MARVDQWHSAGFRVLAQELPSAEFNNPTRGNINAQPRERHRQGRHPARNVRIGLSGRQVYEVVPIRFLDDIAKVHFPDLRDSVAIARLKPDCLTLGLPLDEMEDDVFLKDSVVAECLLPRFEHMNSTNRCLRK